jgi:hypothetical protein
MEEKNVREAEKRRGPGLRSDFHKAGGIWPPGMNFE